MAEVRDDRKRQYKLRVADEPEPEEGRSAHALLRVVQESVDARVRELRGDLLDEEEVGVQPA